jgi:hypothetical protein
MIKDVCFNDPGTLFSGFETSKIDDYFSAADPPSVEN